jgi:transaldolase
LQQAGQSLWLDSISRELLASGRLRRYIEQLSVTGLTSNPTIFDHAIEHSSDYDDDIRAGVEAGLSPEEVFFALALADLSAAAELFRPAHEASGGSDGWVSLEVSPRLAHDAGSTVAEAKSLYHRAGVDNLFIKIPGTEEGAAPDTINTMPEQVLEAFADHGTVDQLLPPDGGDADEVLAAFDRAGVEVTALAAKLQNDGEQAFDASWDSLLAALDRTIDRLGDTR